jgi:hypothetical protein
MLKGSNLFDLFNKFVRRPRPCSLMDFDCVQLEMVDGISWCEESGRGCLP